MKLLFCFILLLRILFFNIYDLFVSETFYPLHLTLWQARREKISERMKILQDLVPGCNKVFVCRKKTMFHR